MFKKIVAVFVLLFCFIFYGNCFCQAADSAESITIGSSPAKLYIADEPPEQFASEYPKNVIVPPGTRLVIKERKIKVAMPRKFEWVKVSYKNSVGWLNANNSIEDEKFFKKQEEIRKEGRQRFSLISKINNETTENNLEQWFGKPKKEERLNNFSKTMVYSFSYEIPEGECWKHFDLSVVINIETGKVKEYRKSNEGEVCH
jgi:hypothetical protein